VPLVALGDVESVQALESARTASALAERIESRFIRIMFIRFIVYVS
jgi:hypothetical protein